MVISGNWWVDTGATWDPENRTVPIKPGTFVTHPGREVHYDGSRAGSEDAIVMIFGEARARVMSARDRWPRKVLGRARTQGKPPPPTERRSS